MARQKTAIFGIYGDGEGVERAVGILQRVGVRNTDISLLFPEKEAKKNFTIQTRRISPEGASAGAVSEGVLGWLVGVGVFTIPGLGPFLVAGPIVAALPGVGLNRGLASSLMSLGLSENHAKCYEAQILRGGILISVDCDRPDWARRAKQILQETGAEDTASGGEASTDSVPVENNKTFRRVLHRKIRLLTALRARRKKRGLVRVNRFRFWKRSRFSPVPVSPPWPAT
jgi:hypothetical protein